MVTLNSKAAKAISNLFFNTVAFLFRTVVLAELAPQISLCKNILGPRIFWWEKNLVYGMEQKQITSRLFSAMISWRGVGMLFVVGN